MYFQYDSRSAALTSASRGAIKGRSATQTGANGIAWAEAHVFVRGRSATRMEQIGTAARPAEYDWCYSE
jgi:hypothetical protein